MARFFFMILACVADNPLGARGQLEILNYCNEPLTFTYVRIHEDSLNPDTNGSIPALSSYSTACYDGRKVVANLSNCVVETVHMFCPAVVKVECLGTRCSAIQTQAPCQTLQDDVEAFCPARSSSVSQGDGCPICECDANTVCFGQDCADGVSRSNNASCVPDDWDVDVPTSTPVPTSVPVPKPSVSPVLVTSAPTATPTVFQKSSKSSKASSLAVLIMAILAGGIAACAIRQTIVRNRQSRLSGLYVDIPSSDVTYTRHTPLRRPPGHRRGEEGHDRGSLEMMMHDDDDDERL